jgi:hypothetical protein
MFGETVGCGDTRETHEVRIRNKWKATHLVKSLRGKRRQTSHNTVKISVIASKATSLGWDAFAIVEETQEPQNHRLAVRLAKPDCYQKAGES